MSRKAGLFFVSLVCAVCAGGMALLYVGQPDELKVQKHAMVVEANGNGSALVSYLDWDGTIYAESVVDQGGVYRTGDAFSVQFKAQGGGNPFRMPLLILSSLFLVCAIIGVILFFIG